MSLQLDNSPAVVGGVDTHKELHVAAVVDHHDRLLGSASFPTTRHGYKTMLAWMRSFGTLRQVGIECTGTYGAGLLRYLQQAGITVLEVTAPDKTVRRKRGKNDTIDAENAAHAAYAGLRTVTPKTRDGMIESLRVLKVCRKTAIAARRIALQIVQMQIISAPDELREPLRRMTRMQLIRTLAAWRPDLSGYRNVTTAYRIPLTNFRGIELRDFPAEIARLALIIAEFQCDVLYRGQKEALAEFLPLNAENWIVCGNALRLDWLSVCPPTGTDVKVRGDDLFETPLEQAEIDFENEGGETYICGNPPYLGSTWQTDHQKADLEAIFVKRAKNWKSLDYVAGWFMKAADYGTHTQSSAAFVSTNSICQGAQVSIFAPLLFFSGHQISFAHTSFKWTNLASHNAGVTVAIISISNHQTKLRRLFSVAVDGSTIEKQVDFINAYLVPGQDVIVSPLSKPADGRGVMEWGNKPTDGGNLFLTPDERDAILRESPEAARFIKRFLGAQEFIRGEQRYCLWIEDAERDDAEAIPELKRRTEAVAKMRAESKAAETRPAAAFPHRFRQIQSVAKNYSLVVARVSSENREYLPIGLADDRTIIGDRNFALYDAPLWNLALIASRLHWVWIGAVCVRLEMRFSYSNTLGWNTFPVPLLTEQNKADLTACAEGILLAREAHFPATIAELYDLETMPDNLRHAHERNDEVLERIYIGRHFKNDTERLEKLFDLYTKMTAGVVKPKPQHIRETQKKHERAIK